MTWNDTISLARRALETFLYSLPEGCRFNVVSYGSDHEFLFKNERSVPYTDENLELAISKIKNYDADLGGTNIYEPLDAIFKKRGRDSEIESHIMLLTDGAVWDTNSVVNLVKQHCSLEQRVHCFGVGRGASEDLIKRCAFKGYGNYFFIYNNDEIEETVIRAITKTRLDYKILQDLKLFDAGGQAIKFSLKTSSQPIVEGDFIKMTAVVDKKPATFSVNIFNPNDNGFKEMGGDVKRHQSQALVHSAIKDMFDALAEERDALIEDAETNLQGRAL